MEFPGPTAVADVADLYGAGCSWHVMADVTAGTGFGNGAPEAATSGDGVSGDEHVCAGVPPGAEKRTRPVYLADSAPTKRGRADCRRVTFAPDAKRQDGLSMDALRFEEFITKDVCSATPRETTAAAACAKAGDVDGLRALRRQLKDLVFRCAALPGGASTPILSSGGGRGDRVVLQHLIFLQKHLARLTRLMANLGGGGGATSE